MSLENIIILGIVIVVAFVVIRFVTKLLAKLIAIALVAAVIILVLYRWNGGLLNLGKNNFIIYDLEQKYCVDEMDTVKCYCIIQPLKEDIESKYTQEELSELTGKRKESLEILMNSIKAEKEIIRDCLREHRSGNELEEFLDELKSSWLNRKLKELFDDEDEETELEESA